MRSASRLTKLPGLLVMTGLLGCSQLEAAESERLPIPEDQRAIAQLNISIAVFDPGVPADPASHRRLQVFPRIREVEALFLPFVLREALVESGEWGAVRVVPEPDIAAELLIYGAIVRSDGQVLELQVRAIDATGRAWLNATYKSEVTADGERQGQGDGGFDALYQSIARDLVSARAQLGEKSLKDVREVSLLRYADQLAPAAFGDYLDSDSDGSFQILRLPAQNDPMLERIERIRRVEYVVTDTVDEKFRELHSEIAATYDLWRQYRWQLAQTQHAEAQRLQNARRKAPRGSFEAMKKSYDNYKWARIEAQELEVWAQGFDNEVGASVEDLESRVAELESLIEDQYAEWGRILAQLFALETGISE